MAGALYVRRVRSHQEMMKMDDHWTSFPLLLIRIDLFLPPRFDVFREVGGRMDRRGRGKGEKGGMDEMHDMSREKNTQLFRNIL